MPFNSRVGRPLHRSHRTPLGAYGGVEAAVDGSPSTRTARACRPRTPLHAGVSGPVHAAGDLDSALHQARYAHAAARAGDPDGARVTSVADLSTLGALLAGVPADVRTAFSSRVLGPLARAGSASHRMLLETLEVFLAHHGSWARTAETLHLHVNTVHYRIQRIETLTGRELSRLDHKPDLRAALLCR
ncbi:PucR family transcriptional regulator [Streptomyces angustmyceticus]|uniref:PucR family transcriptional regulator n=1 Tax=Streptomyces angustmyceticus TaxID=285578 RepID=UPI003D8ECC23